MGIQALPRTKHRVCIVRVDKTYFMNLQMCLLLEARE